MIINGSGRPRLLVLDASMGVVNTITLPYCMHLTETFNPVIPQHTVQSGIQSAGGWWEYSCSLDYSNFIEGETLLDLEPVFQLASDGTMPGIHLVLIPRIDAPQLNYKVIFADGFELGIIHGEGHEKPVFKFKCKDRLPSVPVVQTGYGSHYGGVKPDGSPSAGYGYEL